MKTLFQCLPASFLLSMLLITTEGKHFKVLVSNGTALLQFVDETDLHVLYSEPEGLITGLAVDSSRALVFWSDVSQKNAGIKKGFLFNGKLENVSTVIKDIGEVNGISVDENSELIFWTDEVRKTIECAKYDGQFRHVVQFGQMKKPRGIVVDSKKRYLYWTDQGMRTIERSRLDGSERKVLTKTHVVLPNQIVLYRSNIYWVDAWNCTLMTYHEDAGLVVNEISFAFSSSSNPIFGLAFIGDVAIVTVWGLGQIVKFDMKLRRVVVAHQFASIDRMFSAAIFEEGAEAVPSFVCSSKCSHLCLPVSATTSRCACPSYQNLLLSSDARTCSLPADFLLFTLGSGLVGGFDPIAESRDIFVVGFSSRPVAVAFDFTSKQVYWSDVVDHKIYRAHLNGSQRETFLGDDDTLRSVDGMAFDSVMGNLYFTNVGEANSNEASYWWHRVEVVSTGSRARYVIAADIRKPRGLFLDESTRELYVTDWSRDASVIKSKLNGSLRKSFSDFSNPNGIVKDGSHVWVVDSQTNINHSGDGLIYRGETNAGGKWQRLAGGGLKIPFGLTLLKSDNSSTTLLVSDWALGSIQKIVIQQSDVRSSTLISDLDEPMGLLYVLSPEEAVSPQLDDSKCEEKGGAVCLNPGEAQKFSSYELHAEQCQALEHLLIIGDGTSVVLRDLESKTGTIHLGNNFLGTKDYTGIAYDEQRRLIYVVDNKRQLVERFSINKESCGASSVVLYLPGQHVSHLVLDSLQNLLFWADEVENNIYVASLNETKPRKVVFSRSQQIPTHLNIGPNATLYWLERSYVMKLSLIPQRNNWIAVRLFSSFNCTSLFVQPNSSRLFLGSENPLLIHNCNLEGQECITVRSSMLLSLSHLSVHQDIVYAIDAMAQRIVAVSMDGKQSHLLMKGLVRPSQIHIQHPSKLYCPSDHGCQHKCQPSLISYTCLCPHLHTLALDGKSCISISECPSRMTGSDIQCRSSCFACNTSCCSDARCALAQCSSSCQSQSSVCTQCQCDHSKTTRCFQMQCPEIFCEKSEVVHSAEVCCPRCRRHLVPAQPSFVILDCPLGNVSLPASIDSVVYFNPGLVAADLTGFNRSLQIDVSRSLFYHSEANTFVTATSNKPSTMPLCSYHVLVDDSNITRLACPANLEVITREPLLSVAVPPAIVHHVNGKFHLASLDHLGTEFPLGVTPLTYSFRKLSCSFDVVVRYQELFDYNSSKCRNLHDMCPYWASIGECQKNPNYMTGNCSLSCDTCPDRSPSYVCTDPLPVWNGWLQCRHDYCEVICRDGFVDVLKQKFHCKKGHWQPKFNPTFTHQTCLEISEPTENIELSFSFQPIRTNHSVANDLYRGLSVLLRTQHELSHQNFAIQTRKPVYIKNSKQIVIKLYVEQLKSVIFPNFGNSAKLKFSGFGYDFDPINPIRVKRTKNSCAPGKVSIANATMCKSCPPGTYGQPSSNICIDCPAGSFQDRHGQTSCWKCSGAPPGAHRQSQCLGSSVQLDPIPTIDLSNFPVVLEKLPDPNEYFRNYGVVPVRPMKPYRPSGTATIVAALASTLIVFCACLLIFILFWLRCWRDKKIGRGPSIAFHNEMYPDDASVRIQGLPSQNLPDMPSGESPDDSAYSTASARSLARSASKQKVPPLDKTSTPSSIVNAEWMELPAAEFQNLPYDAYNDVYSNSHDDTVVLSDPEDEQVNSCQRTQISSNRASRQC